MQSTPENVDLDKIKEEVEALSEIDNIHHLHVWKLDDTQIHLESHVNLKNNVDMLQVMQIRAEVEHLLQEKFGIGHITLQFGYECCKGEESLIHQK